MTKELDLFSIDGSCCGNQDQMVNPWMKLGGCAALAAADSCILLTLHNGFSGICPVDLSALNWEEYNRFAEDLRPYLSPRMMGVNRLCYFTDGFGAYLRDIGCHSLSMEALSMGIPMKDAFSALKKQMDEGFPVPILHLNPKTDAAKEYRWHWFLLTGYAEENNDFLVKAVTFGEAEWLRFSALWHETDPENGGLILYRHACPQPAYPLARVASAIICDRPDCPRKILTACSGDEESFRFFPAVSYGPEEDAEKALIQELEEKWNLSVSLICLLAINEYDLPPLHISERVYKAVLPAETEPHDPERKNMAWSSGEELPSVPWRPCDSPLINIVRSDMMDAEVIRKRIAEEEARQNS